MVWYHSAITGGSLTGAVFNPALALSLHFKCFDEAFLQFFMVYWIAPSLGKHIFINFYYKIRVSKMIGNVTVTCQFPKPD